ncbi:DUF4157 domain-containing protein [Streptacidiphilus sp. EB129]|uniref:eCIS core domain-containing protein n=1 Tax=Streptacidiphilus sp. EB129 TaxID=3156262 RepID=UPI0035134835
MSSCLEANAMRERENRPVEPTGAARRAAAEPPAPRHGMAAGWPNAAAVTALQRSAGNRAVARALAQEEQAHDAGCGHDPVGHDPVAQRDLVDEALRSPSRPIERARRTRLEAFHQTDLSGVRVHTDLVAQRSAEALGAAAYTVGQDIVLGAEGDDDETLGHETLHVKQQGQGAVAGTDNGAGLSVSDPGHSEERAATAAGAAFRAGAAHAPSLVAQRAVPAVDSAAAVPQASGQAVQRAGRDEKPGRSKSGGKSEKGGSKAELVKQVTDFVARFTNDHGGGRQGRITNEVRLRFPRDKRHERSGQTLSHLSMLVYDAARAVQDEFDAQESGEEGVDDREVQGMLINDRLVFASNYNESMSAIGDLQFEDAVAALRSVVAFHQSDANRESGLLAADAREYVDRLTRAETKTVSTFAGVRGTTGDATANAVRRDTGRSVIIVDAESPELHYMLTDPGYAGAVIMLRYAKTDDTTSKTARTRSMHAEQKLLLAMERSGLKPREINGPHIIMGKYRPCLGCAGALMYYRDRAGFNSLEFNPNCGYYWTDSVKSLASHLRHVLEDPNYLGYIRSMIDPKLGGAMSVPAMSWQAPPADADYNNGHEIRIPAEEARGRPYGTPSASEAELHTDEEGEVVGYESGDRKLNPYTAGQGGRKVGKGRAVNPGRFAGRHATAEEVQHLKQVTEHGSKEQQGETFRYYTKRNETGKSRLSQKEISEITGLSIDTVSRRISGRTGHEARDSKIPDSKRRQSKKSSSRSKPTQAPTTPPARTAAPRQPDDVEMGGTGAYPSVGPSSSANPSYGSSQSYPEMAGYQRAVDHGTGQVCYVERQTGEHYYYDDGRLRPMPPGLSSPGTGETEPVAGQQFDAMDIDADDEDYDYTDAGKGKGRADRRHG